MKKLVCGYVRVSTIAQVEKYSLDFQREEIGKHCQYKGYKLVKIYEDRGISGTKFEEREGLQELLRDARSGKFKIVLFYHLSRLGRSVGDVIRVYEELEKLGIVLVSIKEGIDTSTPSGKLLRNLLASIAEFERELMLERLSGGRMAKAKAGLYPKGFTCYGYEKSGNGKIVVNEEEKKVLLKIKELLDRGLALNEICRQLNNEGKRSKRGKFFNVTNLRHTLRKNRDIYVEGKADYKGILFEIPKIFSASEYQSILDKIGLHRRIAKRKIEDIRGRIWFTDGMVRCARCKSGLFGESYYKKSDDNFSKRYRCGGQGDSVRGGKNCDLPQIDGNELEGLVWQRIVTLFNDKQFLNKLRVIDPSKVNEKTRREIKRKKDELVELSVRRKRLLDLYTSGKYSEEDLDPRYNRLKKSEEKLRSEVRRLEEKEHQSKVDLNKLKKAIGSKIERYNTAQKIEFVKRLIKSIVIDVCDDGTWGVGIVWWLDLPFLEEAAVIDGVVSPSSVSENTKGNFS